MTGLPIAPLVALGLLFFATPLIVLVLVLALLNLRNRVRRLEARLAELEPRPRVTVTEAEPVPPDAPVSVTVSPASSSMVPELPRAEPVLASHPTPDAPEVTATATSAASPVAPVPEISIPRDPGEDTAPSAAGKVSQLEGRLGGTWLSRVGALLFFLGVGFFLKHAFEHNWIGPKGRVLTGLVAGIAMTVGGIRLAAGPTYRVPAQSLAAMGIGIVYLSLYAAHAFYALLVAPIAFALLAIVTAVGVATALRLESRALAAMATLGGLLAPVILRTDIDAATPLFTYLVILDVGVLAVAFLRGWPGLALLAFAGTQVLYWSWLDRWYHADRLLAALGWATTFFVLFAVWAFARLRSARAAGTVELARSLVILGAPAVYFAVVRRVLEDPSGHRLATLALVLAGLYFVAAHLATGRAAGGPRVALLHSAVALAFLTLAPAVTLGRHDLVIAWSVEGLALLCGGFVLSAPRLRMGGFAVSALAWSRLFTVLEQDTGRAGTFLLAHPALPATVAVVATAALGALVCRARERAGSPPGAWERFVRPSLLLVAVGSAALLLTVELGQFRTLAIPPPYVPVVKSVVWMLAAMAFLALARGDGTRLLLSVATIMLLALAGEALSGLDRWVRVQPSLRPVVWNPRFLAGCLLVVLAWLYGQVAGTLPYLGERARRLLWGVGAVGAALLLLWNLSVEVVLAPLPETRFNPTKLRSAALSLLWALYAFTAMAWGLWRDQAFLRKGAIVLFTVTVLKVLIVDLAGLDALYRILSVLVLGACLLIGSFLYALYARARRRSGETG
jgi:uncharacterized membrane protein